MTLEQKMPTSRATESLSFGTMPRRDKAELTLSPSLARKLNADISSLVGTHVRVRVGNEDIGLTVSGIHNAGYDDIFFSSDIQERLCAQVAGDLTAIGFETESLSDIPVLHDEFASKGITVIDATETVTAVLDSFSRLRITFSAVSAAVAAVSSQPAARCAYVCRWNVLRNSACAVRSASPEAKCSASVAVRPHSLRLLQPSSALPSWPHFHSSPYRADTSHRQSQKLFSAH